MADGLPTGTYAFTLIGVLYPWFLPLLAEADFAAKGSKSISAFIETPAATAGMAVCTAGPIWLILKLEERLASGSTFSLRRLSIYAFLLTYAGFLICNVSTYKDAHYTFVALFALSFSVHAFLRLHDLSSPGARLAVYMGGVAFTTMLFLLIAQVDSLAFWAVECFGFTMLLLFTPIELRHLASGVDNGGSSLQL